MTDKELKRLSRAELLELLISQIEENDKLRAELEKAEEEINRRHIILENAGSIAEAAIGINKIFEVADIAAKQYLESVRLMTGRGELSNEENSAGEFGDEFDDSFADEASE